MSIVRNFNLYLNAGNGAAPYINVNQYDQGEQWIFTLYKEDGTKYTPSTGAIVGIKADNRGIINTGTVDADGRVVINETQQMTAAAGIAIFELLIDGDSHGTANFLVNVEQRPGDNADLSDSDLSLIQEAVDAATTIEDLIEGHDPDEVITDAVDAWLDAHPEATTTVEDGAITIAKLNEEVTTGVFEDMTVGTSLAVMNDEGVTDNLAYKFRQTGGDAVRELDEIVGGTIAWNQLCNSASVTVPNNHKYLMVKGGIVSIGISTGTALTGLTSGTDVVHDLTQMFGTTVADAIYAMEQSSTGSGVAYFRSLFPLDYYEYNTGELIHVSGLSAKITRDADNNVLGNYPLDSSLTLRGVPKWNNGLYFDGDIYRHDGSVSRRYGIVDLGSLAWTNGGSFKLFFSTGLNTLIRKASANTEAADWIFSPNFTPISYNSITGSTAGRICVAASGSIGICDGNTYSSLAEFKTAMSGVYLVYELATPTAETADPYQQYQICDGKGTEEYVSETVTPVGHSTFYPVDIVAKVNKLPSDFSTLIAPTEATFKATRNYTAKQFLIINNQLYRVTANIANGANIVPNTNVTAVTIADILTTLI